MRTIRSVCLAALLTLAPACNPDAEKASPRASDGTELVVIDVGGMTSGVDCPNAVKHMLSNVAGVEDVRVDFETSTATVRIRDGADRTALVSALRGQYIGALRR